MNALLLGEWVCLGVLASGPVHGYALATRVGADTDLGRVWTMSRAMVYRCLDTLAAEGLAEATDNSPDDLRGRTPMAITPAGRRALDAWLTQPVLHLRDVRCELLVKLLLIDELDCDVVPLLSAQREMARVRRAELEDDVSRRGGQRATRSVGGDAVGGDAVEGDARRRDECIDPVVIWRLELVGALERTLDRVEAVASAGARTPSGKSTPASPLPRPTAPG